MTDQEKYKARQKARGIKAGDKVRVIKGLDKDGPEWNGYYSPCEEFKGTKKVEGGGGSSRYLDDGYIYPIAVLEIVKKANGSVPGKVTDNVKEPCRDCKHLDSDVCVDCPTYDGSCSCPTGNPPCSYCTDSLWEELIETDNTNRRESNMKTQEIYSYVASVNKNVMSVETNLIEKVKKDIIVSGVLGADDSDNAKLQVMALVLQARPDVDTSEVSVLVSPFCSE